MQMAWFYALLPPSWTKRAGSVPGARHHPNAVEIVVLIPGHENQKCEVAGGASSWSAALAGGNQKCTHLPGLMMDGDAAEEKVEATQEPEPYVATQEHDPNTQHPEAFVVLELWSVVECRQVPVVGVGFHGQVGEENGGWYHTGAAYYTGNREKESVAVVYVGLWNGSEWWSGSKTSSKMREG